MIGVEAIGKYIPEKRNCNILRKSDFDFDDDFLQLRLGIEKISEKEPSDETSDLCCLAMEDLISQIEINLEEIDMLVVVTQNPDFSLPHTAAIVHGKLGIGVNCAAFDISLGCSGYVYALSIVKSFMESNGLSKGLLFTCDPYSKIIDRDDRNTSMLFGDAATVSLLSNNPVAIPTSFLFATAGKNHENLICRDGKLAMNGRAIFNFVCKEIPRSVLELTQKEGLSYNEIDKFIFHQASKYMIDNLARRMKLEKSQVPFDIIDYGNTVSSSIPIIFQDVLACDNWDTIVLSGFGVGLSWGNCIVKRNYGD